MENVVFRDGNVPVARALRRSPRTRKPISTQKQNKHPKSAIKSSPKKRKTSTTSPKRKRKSIEREPDVPVEKKRSVDHGENEATKLIMKENSRLNAQILSLKESREDRERQILQIITQFDVQGREMDKIHQEDQEIIEELKASLAEMVQENDILEERVKIVETERDDAQVTLGKVTTVRGIQATSDVSLIASLRDSLQEMIDENDILKQREKWAVQQYELAQNALIEMNLIQSCLEL